MIPFLSILSPIVGKILDKIPDAGARDKARMEFELQIVQQETKLIELLQASDNKQADVNIEEAKSANLFVSGWRPFCGWACGISLAWQYIVAPVITYVLTVSGHPVTLPVFDFSTMSTILMGMLGLGSLRTYEKYQDVQHKH